MQPFIDLSQTPLPLDQTTSLEIYSKFKSQINFFLKATNFILGLHVCFADIRHTDTTFDKMNKADTNL